MAQNSAPRRGPSSGRSGGQPGGGSGGRPGGGSGGRGAAGRGGARGDAARGDAGRGSADRGPHATRADRPAGTFDNSERRGGQRLAPKAPRLPDPRIAEGVTGKELDRSVRQQLRTLSKENADGVAQHLVMVAGLLEAGDLTGALAHAETAVRRAGRVPAAREALGMVAYRQGDFARALGEFRTVRRLSGSSHLLPLMVDCERGLGRNERALELATSKEAATLAEADRVELTIVLSGLRRDLGQLDAAVVALQIPQLTGRRRPYSARLSYAYAEALLARGERDDARVWFARALEADSDLETDAAERVDELDGVEMTDALADDDTGQLDGSVGAGLPGTDAARVGERPDGGERPDDSGPKRRDGAGPR